MFSRLQTTHSNNVTNNYPVFSHRGIIPQPRSSVRKLEVRKNKKKCFGFDVRVEHS